ncbi:hypothetical protein [Rhodopseudomonas parapalustris]
MSSSSLWVMDKNFNGTELTEFRNSWYFSPIVWDVLSDKYIPQLISTPYGYKKSIIMDSSLFRPLNDKVNNCGCIADRICWEMSNQQIFFTKDKELIANSILQFVEVNSKFSKNSDGEYLLKAEHIAKRFKEIADAILELNEEITPYFIFKNSSCDDNVEYWFSKYDENEEEYFDAPLSEMDKVVTEFVFIENGEITGFKTNIDYFSR